jgi:hypothetical protein
MPSFLPCSHLVSPEAAAVSWASGFVVLGESVPYIALAIRRMRHTRAPEQWPICTLSYTYAAAGATSSVPASEPTIS